MEKNLQDCRRWSIRLLIHPLIIICCLPLLVLLHKTLRKMILLDLLYPLVVKDDLRIEHVWFSSGDSLFCQGLAMHMPLI